MTDYLVFKGGAGDNRDYFYPPDLVQGRNVKEVAEAAVLDLQPQTQVYIVQAALAARYMAWEHSVMLADEMELVDKND